jgi:hypothetical protein
VKKCYTNGHQSILKSVETRVWESEVVFGTSIQLGKDRSSSFILNFGSESLWVGKEQAHLRAIYNSASGVIVSHDLSIHGFLTLKQKTKSHIESINVTERGSVLFNLKDGSKKLVTASGETSEYKAKNNVWVTTNLDGEQFVQKSTGLESIGKMWIAKQSNVETNSSVITREDMLQIKKTHINNNFVTVVKCE